MGSGPALHGLKEGDTLLPCRIAKADGSIFSIPSVTLHLDPAAMGLSPRYGKSWRERCLDLIKVYGPYALAYLECLFRNADIRASQWVTEDPLLGSDLDTFGCAKEVLNPSTKRDESGVSSLSTSSVKEVLS